MNSIRIRPATETDLVAINAIYNYYVLHSTCTYQTEPETDEARAAWFQQHGPMHPVIVAERAGAIVGWGSLSRFHPRQAYSRTVEDSVYVTHDMQGKGIGKAILTRLLELAQSLGYHSVIGSIDGDQAASIALHAKFGFVHYGRLREGGQKFGRWLDVVYMQKMR